MDKITTGGYSFKLRSDKLGRNIGKSIENVSEIAFEKISYKKVGDRATNIPVSVSYKNSRMTYAYDSKGNIKEIRENGNLYARYFYDSLNRIIREDNKQINKTETYSYDNNGNILEKRIYGFTLIDNLEQLSYEEKKYQYDGDKLLSYNGECCVYDAVGNPTTYREKPLTWSKGRQLVNYNGTSFSYNGRGQRTSKNGITFTYDTSGKIIKQSNGLEFIYHASGVAGVIYGGNTYFYRKDAQGNVISLLDNNGEVVVRYTYDAWGNNTVTNADGTACASGIGILNPYRYRSYYFDTETNLYYLQTRYYDPETGRFISQDDVSYLDPEHINGLNLYAYCGNNPVMYADPTGCSVFLTMLILAIIAGAAIGGTLNGVKAYNEGATGWGLFGAIAGGALVGGAMGASLVLGGAAGLAAVLPAGATIAGFGLSAGAALGISVGIGVIAGTGGYLLENGLREDRSITFKGAIMAGLSGGVKAATTFGIGYLGGRMGAFDKMFLNPLLKGASTLS